jgi:uncharacterized membrane protein YgcG
MNKLLRVCAALFCWLGLAFAVDWKALKPEGYVSDFAHVIDAQSKAALEQYGTVVERVTGVQMALVTVQTLEGEPIDDVANTIFRAWGVGHKGKNDGILLLLVIGDRRSRLEVGYELEPILPDGFSGSILREMRPALRQKQYGEAMMAAAQAIGSTIAKSKNVSLDAQLPRRVLIGRFDTMGAFVFRLDCRILAAPRAWRRRPRRWRLFDGNDSGQPPGRIERPGRRRIRRL